MSSHYTYIIASLPMLWFNASPAISSRRFLDSCGSLLGEGEFAVLRAILEDKKLPKPDYAVLKHWSDFDTGLRNELTRHRAGRKKKDPHRYIRENEYWSPDITHAAMAAYKNTSVLEAERILDLERWRFLDDLCFGHYFDFEFLIIYALKLKILERWEDINRADKGKLLEGALS